jgi:hypothetical protein
MPTEGAASVIEIAGQIQRRLNSAPHYHCSTPLSLFHSTIIVLRRAVWQGVRSQHCTRMHILDGSAAAHCRRVAASALAWMSGSPRHRILRPPPCKPARAFHHQIQGAPTPLVPHHSRRNVHHVPMRFLRRPHRCCCRRGLQIYPCGVAVCNRHWHTHVLKRLVGQAHPVACPSAAPAAFPPAD